MFVDASAFVAVIMREPGFEAIADRLRTCPMPLTSALAVYEAVLAIARKKDSYDEVQAAMEAVLSVAQIEIVPLAEPEMQWALTAFLQFGKGRGHPAKLNMGDCFAYAYACARTHDVPLLFVGNDFSRTDIPSALA
jgi:ribonuclease VapC